MRPERFQADSLLALFRTRTIATMGDLKAALGTEVEMTVRRKLRTLGYLSSYSHRGQFYTLAAVARFDARGLFHLGEVHFSRFGSLLATAEHFVGHGPAGYFAAELRGELQVESQEALLTLVRRQQAAREAVAGRYLYCSIDPAVRQAQLARRRQATATGPGGAPAGRVDDETKGRPGAVLQHPRRAPASAVRRPRIAAARARRGPAPRGGDGVGRPHGGPGAARVAGPGRGAGPNPGRGRRAQAGGKKTPEVITAIQGLLESDTAGDPITGIKWSRKTTRKISGELQQAGIAVSHTTVARLLHQLHYRLRVNRKQLAGATHPQRNEQFEYIQTQRRRCEEQGLPVISVDTKKKELVGCFRNAGALWAHRPRPVNDHDFRSDALGIAIPYGIYETPANCGGVFVGTSHNTPAFAVAAIARWWATEGRSRYPHAAHLLILADNGGSNGSRCRAWRYELQHQLVNPLDLTVTVSHYPPGTSKWNPIEHRLFAEISKNWAGEPLVSYETILNYIRTTRTETGLTVSAALLDGDYPTGIKISDEQMAQLDLRPHDICPMWNYTIRPQTRKCEVIS